MRRPSPRWRRSEQRSEQRAASFVLSRLISRTSLPSEKLLLLLSAVFAAVNGIGFPLLPVLFARTVADFSTLYNPNLQEDAAASVVQSSNLDPVEVTSRIQRMSLYALLFGLAAAISTYFMSFIQIKVARAIAGRIRARYFSSLMRQDAAWHNRFTVGELSARVTNIEAIEHFIARTSIIFVRDIFAIVIGFIFAFTNSWRMSLVIVAFMPVIAIVGGIVAFISNREGKAVNEASGRATGTVHETISLIRSVLAYGGQPTEQARYKYDLDELYKREIRRTGAVAFGTGFLMLVLMGCFAAGFLVGSTFVTDGIVTLAGAVAATAVVPAVFAAFRVANSQKEVADASTAAQSLFEVVDRQPSIDPLSDSGIIIEDFQGGITFENVDFKYEAAPNPKADNTDDPAHETPAQPIALSSFSFEMQPGSSHALCGPSGSGKSTVVSLIERFYDVTGGKILLDGKVDIRDVNLRWLRSQIGHVGQTPSLLQGTVRQNIENGVPSEFVTDPETGKQSLQRRFVPLQEVVAAAKAAHAHEFIEGLPDGYETQVGEGGALLSGGQKQRICIARALIRNPKILLLDESTASLDNNSEAIVQRALDEASANRTTLTIAHRLSSLRNTQHVNVLTKGKLVESGTHEVLMGIEGGVYRNMVELQLQKTPSNSSDSVRGDDLPGRGDSTTTDPSARDVQDEFAMPEDGIMLDRGSDEIRKISKRRGLGRRIFAMQKQDAGIISLGVFGSMAVGVAWPLAAACIAELLHVGVATDRGSEVLKWSLLLLGCGIGAFIGILVQHTFLTMSGERLTRRARIKAFGAILSQDMSFFDRKENDAGSMSVKLNTQVPLLRQLSSDAAGCAALGFSSVITGLTIALYYCPLVSLATALFVPGLLLSGYSVFKVGVNYTDKKVIESVRIAAEAVYSIRTVSAFGLEHDYIQRYEALVLNRGEGGKAFSKTIFPSIMMAYIAASPHCLFGASFWVGSIVLRDGKCDLLDMNKAILGLFFGSVLVGDVTHVVPKPNRAKLAAAEYFDLTDSYAMEIAKNKRITGTKSIDVKGDIEIKEVRFTYPNRPEIAVLKGFSTSVKAGQTLALVGESGSGKSTIISLIERFYGSRKGSILIDGMDINDIELSELRSMIGLVHQNPELFNRTVRENIAYGLSHEDGTYIPQEQIEEAARVANIHHFITTLPQGYDTVVGVRGDKLSGGQKQRVAIARAIVRQPPILLLDEATSALDVGSEKLVQEGLDAAANGRTTITIAHRLVTIRNADRIGVVQSGVIVEEGSHEELVRKRGLYADLLRSQANHEDV